MADGRKLTDSKCLNDGLVRNIQFAPEERIKVVVKYKGFQKIQHWSWRISISAVFAYVIDTYNATCCRKRKNTKDYME